MLSSDALKRIKAVRLLNDEGVPEKQTAGLDNLTLYQHIESLGYQWNATAGEWQLREPAPQITDWSDDGIVEFRLNCHAGNAMQAIERLQQLFELTEVSKPYPNRKGQRVRVYITATLKEGVS